MRVDRNAACSGAGCAYSVGLKYRYAALVTGRIDCIGSRKVPSNRQRAESGCATVPTRWHDLPTKRPGLYEPKTRYGEFPISARVQMSYIFFPHSKVKRGVIYG